MMRWGKVISLLLATLALVVPSEQHPLPSPHNHYRGFIPHNPPYLPTAVDGIAVLVISPPDFHRHHGWDYQGGGGGRFPDLHGGGGGRFPHFYAGSGGRFPNYQLGGGGRLPDYDQHLPFAGRNDYPGVYGDDGGYVGGYEGDGDMFGLGRGDETMGYPPYGEQYPRDGELGAGIEPGFSQAPHDGVTTEKQEAGKKTEVGKAVTKEESVDVKKNDDDEQEVTVIEGNFGTRIAEEKTTERGSSESAVIEKPKNDKDDDVKGDEKEGSDDKVKVEVKEGVGETKDVSESGEKETDDKSETTEEVNESGVEATEKVKEGEKGPSRGDQEDSAGITEEGPEVNKLSPEDDEAVVVTSTELASDGAEAK